MRTTDTRRESARVAGLLGTTALAFGLLGGAAMAQAAPADGEALTEVVVTGSRAALAGFKAPTPTAVIGVGTINQQAVTNVATILNQIPAFKGTRSPSGTAQNTVSPAQATADLRGLGGQRTVVLINGNRVVPFAPSSNLSVPTAVDLNLLPTIMIDRVEVVTGGASAQYGSDAVAGVVNLIMRNRFSGLEVRGQAGVSQYGDYHGYRLAVIGGADFAGGRGHFTAAIDGYDNDGLGDSSKRPWAKRLSNVYSNSQSATNGRPAFLNIGDVRSALSPNGLITSGPLKNLTFAGGNSVVPYNTGVLNNGTAQVGGDGAPINAGQQLVPAVRTGAIYTHTEYQLAYAVKAYVELSYAYSRGVLNALPTSRGGYGGSARISGTIQGSNPFLPAAVAAAYNGVGGNPSSFTFSKQDFQVGGGGAFVTNTTPRGLIGFEGEIGDFGLGSNWRWDAHAEYGENHYKGSYRNTTIQGNGNPASGPVIPNRVALALDAVTVTAANVGSSGLAIGSIACRSRLTSNNGCVPFNPFGPNSGSAESIAWFQADAENNVYYKQTDAALNLRGEPFSLWAGPVAIATGLEYRKESESLRGDELGRYNAYTSGNAPDFSGSFSVKEGYFEANAPLAKDQPFAKTLNFQGAIRYADYSNVGSQTTWKLGLNWEPVAGLRFRVTESKDIRAPQLWELFSPGNAQTNNITVRNKLTGVLETVLIPQNSSGGNPNVRPENAKTKTIGVVWQPSEWLGGALKGLDVSVDYYDIKINDAITNFQGANVATLCNQGQQVFCDFFAFNASGTAVSLYSPSINLGSIQTKGYDFVVSYRRDLAELNSRLRGRWTTAFSGSYVPHVYVNAGFAGAPTIDRAGENGQANQSTGGAQPYFRANLAGTYELGKFSGTVQFLYVAKGRLDNTYNTGVPSNTIDNNVVKPYVNINVFSNYQLTPRLQLFGAVHNLFNTEPANSPYSVLNTAVSGAYYDKVGRAFQIGFDYKF